MMFVPLEEFRPRVCVALPAEMLECVGRSHAADLGANAVAGAERHAFQKPSAECIADARRIDYPVGWNRRDIRRLMPLEYGTAVLAARDHERPAPREYRGFVEAGFLPNQFELVVVAHDDRRRRQAVPELVA